MVPLNLRRAETCRLKLGARRRKEKGGREREIDYGEVSQVNVENFSFPLIRACSVKVNVNFIQKVVYFTFIFYFFGLFFFGDNKIYRRM